MDQRFQHQRGRWVNRLLVAFVLLTCLRFWAESTSVLSEARAQLPDTAGQRLALIKETRKTNQLLADIKQILSAETLNVRLQGADNQATAPVVRRRSKP